MAIKQTGKGNWKDLCRKSTRSNDRSMLKKTYREKMKEILKCMRKYYQKKKAEKEEQKRLEDEANGVSSEEQPKGNKTILQRKNKKM